jgi:hypothetical protein
MALHEINAEQLLARRSWDKLLEHQGLMTPFIPEEIKWVARCWHTKAQQRTDMLYGAIITPRCICIPVLGGRSSTAVASLLPR